MEKKIAVFTEDRYRSYLDDLFFRLGQKYGRVFSPVHPDAFSSPETSVCDGTLLFYPQGAIPDGLGELVRKKNLYARVREIRCGETEYVLVDNAFGGIYDEEKGFRKGELGREAYDVERCSEIEIERLARVAFAYCEKLRCPLRSLDLSDRLYVSRLWRRAVRDVGSDYENVPLLDEYVTDYVGRLPSAEKENVLVSTALFCDMVYAAIYSHGGSDATISYVNDGVFGVFGATEPTALPHAIGALLNALGSPDIGAEWKNALRRMGEGESLQNFVDTVLR